MDKIIQYNTKCEAMELDYMTSPDWGFLTSQLKASLDVLLTISVNSLMKITKDMTIREKNLICNMFVANLNEATTIKRNVNMQHYDDFTPFIHKFEKAGLTPNEVERAMAKLRQFEGLTYPELRNVANGIVMWLTDERDVMTEAKETT